MSPLPSVGGSSTDTSQSSSFDTASSASGIGVRLGECPTPTISEQYIAPSAEGDTKPQLRGKNWAAFVAGNLILIAVVVTEIIQLFGLRLEDYAGRCGEETPGASEGEIPSLVSVSPFVDSAILFLISGLGFHVYFSIVLSLVYRSPLSIQSLHQIPAEGSMSKAVLFNVYCLAPLSWTLTYAVGWTGSLMFGRIPSCEWKGGVVLGVYLLISGLFMFVLFAVPIFFLSLGGLCTLCCTDNSTRLGVREVIRQTIWSKGLFLDTFWQLQGVLWVYRVGGLGLAMSAFVAVCSVVGVTLTAVGSRPAPHTAHTLRDDDVTIAFDDAV